MNEQREVNPFESPQAEQAPRLESAPRTSVIPTYIVRGVRLGFVTGALLAPVMDSVMLYNYFAKGTLPVEGSMMLSLLLMTVTPIGLGPILGGSLMALLGTLVDLVRWEGA